MVDKYKPEITEDGWVYFSKRPAIKEFVVNLLQDKSSLGLNEGDILVTKNGIQLLKHVSGKNKVGDENGVLVIDQTHGNLPVELAQFAIHCDEAGNVKMMHGKLAKNLPPPTRGVISENTALQKALVNISKSGIIKKSA